MTHTEWEMNTIVDVKKKKNGNGHFNFVETTKRNSSKKSINAKRQNEQKSRAICERRAPETTEVSRTFVCKLLLSMFCDILSLAFFHHFVSISLSLSHLLTHIPSILWFKFLFFCRPETENNFSGFSLRFVGWQRTKSPTFVYIKSTLLLCFLLFSFVWSFFFLFFKMIAHFQSSATRSKLSIY